MYLLLLLHLCLLLVSSPDLQRAPGFRDMVINEIHFAPTDSKLEFIELYNRSTEAFDLSALSLADSRRKPRPISHTSIMLGPGAYAVLIRNRTTFEAAFPGVEAIPVSGWPALNNSGDLPMLLYGDVVIDSVAYESDWGEKGLSLERIDPHGPSHWPKNWAPSSAPSGATPGQENANYALDITPPVPLFAQQVNPTTAEVLFDSPVSDEEPLIFNFQIGTRHPVAAILQGYGEQILLTFDAPVSSSVLTMKDLRDIPGNRLEEATFPLAQPAMVGDLILNEIMYEPDQDLPYPQPEYIELYNTSSHWISLYGLHLTDEPDANGAADTLNFGNRRIALAPGSFAVVYAEDQTLATEETVERSSLSLSFSLKTIANQAVFLPIHGHALGLRNDGDLIRLQSRNAVLDEVRYAPHWHHPHLRSTRGIALERLAPHLPSGAAETWTSSLATEGGTPGTPNAVHFAPEETALSHGITVSPTPFSPDGDGFEEETEIRYFLRYHPALIRVRIYDLQGRLIRTLEAAGLATVSGSLWWDGRREDGRLARMGPYIVHLEAFSSQHQTAISYKHTVVLARPMG